MLSREPAGVHFKTPSDDLFYPGVVAIESSESAGIDLDLLRQDDFWSLLRLGEDLGIYAAGSRGGIVISLAESASFLDKFKQGCALDIAEQHSGQPSENTQQVSSYACNDGTSLFVTFDFTGDVYQARIAVPGELEVDLTEAVSASGSKYTGDGIELHTKADEAFFSRPGRANTNCVER